MTPILMVVLLVGVGLLVIAVFLKGLFAAVQAGADAAIDRAHPAEDIVLRDGMANSLGLESKGPVQLRGNGGLVLTREELHFLPLVGVAEVRVALDQIRKVSLVRVHLGKTLGRKLLRVDFGEGEAADAVAFSVADPERWLTELRQRGPSEASR